MKKIWRELLPLIEEGVKTKTLEELSTQLKVDKEDLRLFLHRYRKFKVNRKNNLCIRLIEEKFTYPEYFMPNEKFYDATGIRQRRWWQIYKGEKTMTEMEYMAVCKHLKIDKNTAMNIRQLDIFEHVL